ncbi:YcnI family protein [Aquihabitans sp. McL0605]|uniref:YcnI family copper-binding membrane protein n=1 Tax=Aquihabitans sp. McL0605 TaxID=3415671 RepID=UPI003CF7C827
MVRRLLAVPAVVAVVIVGTGLAAWAHVTVDPGSAPKGGTDQELTFRVPNEDNTASTVKVDMQIPSDPPLVGVEAASMPGWKVEVKTVKLAKPITTDDGTITEAASEVIWTGGSIAPGEYGDFRLIVGQLPDDADQVRFPTIQTYSDGREVSWIDDTPSGGGEAEHPAPVLTLTAAADTGGADTGGAATTTTPAVAVTAASQSDVDDANSKATIGIVIGIVGVLVGAAAIVIARRRSATD